MQGDTITNFFPTVQARWHSGEQRLTGAVQFHWRKAEFLGDICVFDCQGFLYLRGTWDREAVLVALFLEGQQYQGKVKEALRTGFLLLTPHKGPRTF